MDITTWNINSIRARRERFADWLASRQPDVLCLQETKVVDGSFPTDLFEDAGYHVIFHGQKTYNGVAIAARTPIEDVVRGVPFLEGDTDARGIAATVNGVRVVNVYVVNGKDVGEVAPKTKISTTSSFPTPATCSCPGLRKMALAGCRSSR